MEKPRLKPIWLAIIALLLLGSLLVWVLVFVSKKGDFSITFYDVGQGDSALIQTKNGYNILVDGGPNNKVVEYLDRDLPLNDRELDFVILTHPQADHMTGLIQTLKKFHVKKVLASHVSNETALYQQWVDTLNSTKTPIEYVKEGQSITTSDGVSLQFIWPQQSEKFEVKDLNEASIVFKLSYGDLDILMTGDNDSQTQPYPTHIGQIEVLKVPHHGSKTALKDEFLKEIHPQLSVISVAAKNRYGHPRAETLEQLKKIGSQILRTDQNGNIKIVSDEHKWYTQTQR